MVQYSYFANVRPFLICLILVQFFIPLYASVSSQSSNANTVVDISVICHQFPEHEQFCQDFLKSLPGAGSGADVVTLTEKTTDFLLTNGTNMLNILDKLIQKTKGNLTDQTFLGRCLISYGGETGEGSDDGVVFLTRLIQNSLKSKDYFAIEYFVVVLDDKNGQCFQQKDLRPPADLAYLEGYSHYIHKVVYVLKALLYYLENK